MSSISISMKLGDIVSERPARARVFEAFGIDYCGFSDRTLRAVCKSMRIDVARVIAGLSALEQAADIGDNGASLAAQSLTDLCDGIVSTHHDFLRRELPRLAGLLSRVATAHSGNFSMLGHLQRAFRSLFEELVVHLVREEQVLFPLIKGIDSGEIKRRNEPALIRRAITALEGEHHSTTQLLRRMRNLTDDYFPPRIACATWRVLYGSLEELEADLRLHIHTEDHVLYPRALQAESAIFAG